MSSCDLKQYVSSQALFLHTYAIEKSTIHSQFYMRSIIFISKCSHC